MEKITLQKMQVLKVGSRNRHWITFQKIISPICLTLVSLFALCTTSWALDNSSLNGTYVVYLIENALWGANDGLLFSRGEITFNGNGGYTDTFNDENLERDRSEDLENLGSAENPDHILRYNYSTTYSSSPSTEAGTYSVQSDGTVTLFFTDEGQPTTETGFVSADGNTVLFGGIEYEGGQSAYTALIVGVKAAKKKGVPWLMLLITE